ncbi:MAG: VCBS repeat-containing protein [Chloracidobacterium sp.]|nr:VCBS repeat-containing protein [Chloracidobacterium sp.]
MRAIKILVCSAFIMGCAGISLYNSGAVSGQGGGSSLSAPTGIIASDNKYNNKVRVEWDAIRGATSYRIFRNTLDNAATATEVGTTPANTFLDMAAAPGQTLFYWVRAENASGVSVLSSSDSGSRANATQQGPVPPLEPPPVPPANPITASKVYLGKALFWDEQLSSTRTVSCGTCHTPAGGGDDLRARNTPATSTNPGLDQLFGNADDIVASRGVPTVNADGTYALSSLFGLKEQVTGRSSMSYLNAGYSPVMFWDGRATQQFRDPITNAVILQVGGALESQILGPPTNPTEMSHAGRDWNQVAARITSSKPLAVASNVPAPLTAWINGRSYPELFREVFGSPDVTPVGIALAIATYERTLYTDQTPLDIANAGITPLTQQEQNGRNLFVGNQCAVCHAGSLTSDNSFRYIGVRPTNDDTGRFQVTGNNADLGRFRTPSLRNVELRGTFFHNGRFSTLDEVVAFYNRGGDFNAPNKDGNVRPRGLSAQQQADIVAFLRRPHTDPRAASELPPFDRPTLYSETDRVPKLTGTGVAGSGAQVPQPVAVEPPLVGNPAFTVAVANALGGATATLVINSTDPGTVAIPASGSFIRQTINLQGNGPGGGFGSAIIAIPDDPALVGETFFGRWYIDDTGATGGFSVSRIFSFTIFGESTAVNSAAHVDFDGDNKTDISLFRPSNGQWWFTRSSDNQTVGMQFGNGTDEIVPADFTGDGKTDVAVWRSSVGQWFILRSEDNSFYAVPFGSSGDVPTPADFDADGKADVAVFRPSTATWFIQASSQGTIIRQFGASGDIPQVGDYDNDGKPDIAIYRPSVGQWWIDRSSAGLLATQFGVSSDIPAAMDYTGDGKTDIAFWRPSSGEWFVLRSEDLSFYAVPFGTSTDLPAPGDYDGDGKADAAVFRPSTGTWYVNRSTQGILITAFGVDGDLPAPGYQLP